MGRGTPANKGGRGTGRNTDTNNNYRKNNNGGNRTNQLDVSALTLVSLLGGGTGLKLGALDALHATIGLGG